MPSQDYILCECALLPLQLFVAETEQTVTVEIVKQPAICMVMIKAEDSVDAQPFYLGEALATDCELLVNGVHGIGICLGDEPQRSYCIAFIDAYTQIPGADTAQVNTFLTEQANAIDMRDKQESELIMRTRVDFKLMEQD